VPAQDNQSHSDTTSFVSHIVVTPGTKIEDNNQQEAKDPDLAAAEQAFIERERKKSEEVHAKSAGFKPKHGEEPKAEIKSKRKKAPHPTKKAPQQAPMTKPSQNANLEELAQSGNAFSVASLQKLANRQPEVHQIGPNEMEIDLR